MTAVRLGQQGSQEVGSGFESLSCQIFLRFTLSIFWCPKIVKQWRVPLRCFSALWDKKFSTENLDTPPSPLIHKLFRCRKLSETQHRRVHLQNFSALWDIKFSTENLDTPPSPLLSIHFFATGNVLKHSTEGFTYKIFRHCETKNFRRKNLILPLPSYP